MPLRGLVKRRRKSREIPWDFRCNRKCIVHKLADRDDLAIMIAIARNKIHQPLLAETVFRQFWRLG